MILFAKENTSIEGGYGEIVTESSLEKDFFNIMRESLALEHLSSQEGMNEIVREGFSDVVNSVVTWIKKFLKYIYEAFKRLFMFIESMFMDTSRFFDKYKDKLDLKEPLKIHMYEYDVAIMKKIPNLTPLNTLISDFNDFASKKGLKKEDIKEETRKFLDPKTLNKLRSDITGLSGNIDEDALTETLRKAFRKGADETEEREITESEARNIINNYKANKDYLDTAKKEKYQLEATLSKLKSYFEKGPQKLYAGEQESIRGSKIEMHERSASFGAKEDMGIKYPVADAIYRLNYLKMKEIASITNTVLIEKVNALKEMVKIHAAVGKKAILSSGKVQDDTKAGDKDAD